VSPTPPPPPPFSIGERVTIHTSAGPLACTVTSMRQDATGAWTQVWATGPDGYGTFCHPPGSVVRGWLPEARR
jgi:hypothetical protein